MYFAEARQDTRNGNEVGPKGTRDRQTITLPPKSDARRSPHARLARGPGTGPVLGSQHTLSRFENAVRRTDPYLVGGNLRLDRDDHRLPTLMSNMG